MTLMTRAHVFASVTVRVAQCTIPHTGLRYRCAFFKARRGSPEGEHPCESIAIHG